MKLDLEAYDISASVCPSCGYEADAATATNGYQGPQPGETAVCFNCGHVMKFDENMRLRNPTDEEILEMAGDPDLLDAMKMRDILVDIRNIEKSLSIRKANRTTDGK